MGSQELHPVVSTHQPAIVKPSNAAVLRAEILYRARIASSAIQYDVSQEIARGTAFLFVPVWLGIGAVSYFIANFEPTGLSVCLLICTLTVVTIVVRANRRLRFISSIILLIAFGFGCAKFQSWRMSTPMLAGEIATQVTGRIVSINQTAKSYRAVLDVLQTAKPTLRYAPHRVRATLRQGAQKLVAGDTIQVRLRLMPPSGPVRPRSYDFAFQSYFDGIGASGFAIGPVIVQSVNSVGHFNYGQVLLEQVRQTIAMRIRSVIGGTEGEVAVALIAGVQSGIDEETMESLRITGLAHILSISGLHMALVAGVFMVFLRGGFALFPNQAAHRPVKKYAAALALLASFFYLLLSGSDVAALRSFIMLAVFLVAITLDQQALTMRNLTIAAIAILIATPHEIMGPSFQMSFAATAALISAYAFWTKTKSHVGAAGSTGIVHQIWSKAWRFIGALALTSIIAGSATSLFSAWHFHRLAPMGLPANLAAMPPVSLLVMPSAVASALAMPFGLEEWPLRAMGAGIKMMLIVSSYFAKISSAGLSGALNTGPFLLAVVTLITACFLQTRLKWIALIPVPILAIMFWQPNRPDILISEDAKLVAVHVANGVIAINRERANAFTIRAWQKALLVNSVLGPATTKDSNQATLFKCQDLSCTISLKNGTQITWLGYPKIQRYKPRKGELSKTNSVQPPANIVQPPANTQVETFTDRAATQAILSAKFNAAIEDLCGKTDLLILQGPASPRTCKNTKTLVLSARDLALYGSTEIYLNNDIRDLVYTSSKTSEQKSVSSQPLPEQPTRVANPIEHKPLSMTFAIGEPNRPWNFERKFSRAARNLPPFQPIPVAKSIQ